MKLRMKLTGSINALLIGILFLPKIANCLEISLCNLFTVTPYCEVANINTNYTSNQDLLNPKLSDEPSLGAMGNLSSYSSKVDLSDAIITSSHSNWGSVQDCFDGDSISLMRSDVNPAWVQIEFPSPKNISGIRVLLGQVGYTFIDQDDWWVEAANSVADLNNKAVSYEIVVNKRFNAGGKWDHYNFLTPVSKKIWKIWIKRTIGDDYVHIPEIEFYALLNNIPGLPKTLQLYKGWTWHNLPKLNVIDDGLIISNKQLAWNSTNPNVAYVDANGNVIAVSKGTTTIKAKYENLSSSDMVVTVKEALRTVERGTIEPFLKNPASNAVFETPILIINFIPTADNVNVDPAYSFEFGNNITVSKMKDKILAYNKRIKFAIEQGSRFRNYKNPASRPSIGYKVLDYITVYEPLPPAGVLSGYDGGTLQYGCDYEQIFNRFNIRDYIENKGVKEIWIWADGINKSVLDYYGGYNAAIHFPENYRGNPESNMSSPLTGDISNSYRLPDDLPIYSKSYMVIHQSPNRTAAINMEPHTHQFESMFTYINQRQDGNSDLFWKKFVGTIGRCGWTHTPPNTTINYGYFSYIQHDAAKVNSVLSDIEDWKPDNSGKKTLVSYHNWEDKIYKWPDYVYEFEERFELQWFIYWLQSIPGYQNNIPIGDSKTITNWWEIIASWDNCIINQIGLHSVRLDSIRPTFDSVDPVCPGSAMTALPTTSKNGIKGTWSPALNNTKTTVYTFNPAGGQRATTATLSITVKERLETPHIYQEEKMLYSSYVEGNQWYDQNGAINGATSQSYSATGGAYYVIVTLDDCCSDKSNVINVFVTDKTNDLEQIEYTQIYPNPVSNELNIEAKGNKEKLNFEILNEIGQIIFRGNLVEKTTIQTSSFPQGVYMIKIDNGKIVEYKKIIKN